MRNVFIPILFRGIISNDEGCAVEREVDECGNFLILSWFKWPNNSIKSR
jgi:hypothetical protein